MDVLPEHLAVWWAWYLAGRPTAGIAFEALPRLPTFEELTGPPPGCLQNQAARAEQGRGPGDHVDKRALHTANSPTAEEGQAGGTKAPTPAGPSYASQPGLRRRANVGRGANIPGPLPPPEPGPTGPPRPVLDATLRSPASRLAARPGRRVIQPGDHALLRQLGRTGVATARHARCAGVSLSRIKALLQGGVLAESSRLVSNADGPRPVQVLTLAPKGRRFVRSRLGVHLYNHNRRQAAHDLRLTAIYWELPPYVRETWRCEGELIAQWKAAGTYQRGVCVDAAVEVDGELTAIEVAIGYSERDRANKTKAIARHFGGRGHLITEE